MPDEPAHSLNRSACPGRLYLLDDRKNQKKLRTLAKAPSQWRTTSGSFEEDRGWHQTFDCRLPRRLLGYKRGLASLFWDGKEVFFFDEENRLGEP
jgi:hypothetical protein